MQHEHSEDSPSAGKCGQRVLEKILMDKILFWPLQAFLWFCAYLASWFVDEKSLNFLLIQMAVALLTIVTFVFVAAYWSHLLNFFKRLSGHHT
ncbi:MAG TPA: hypothetical protein VFQ90_02585 [Stellaceae bacterium]|jgi:hypothetical protein|nr:hypothetical protein [Stellaceae bacterium]